MKHTRYHDIPKEVLEALRRQELTIIILTLNEEATLATCLASIPAGLDVLVVDSGSQDRTIEIAKQAGAQTVLNDWQGFAALRNYALYQLPRSGWRLFVDADELYSPGFYYWAARELGQSSADVYEIPTTLVFEGKRLNRAPGYPIYHPRLVRSHVVFSKSGSGHGETIKRGFVVERAPEGYDHHFMAHGLKAWLSKHVGLAELEANAAPSDGVMTIRRRLGSIAGASLIRAPARFSYHYFLRFGFLDGRAGFRYSMIYTWYEVTKWLLYKK